MTPAQLRLLVVTPTLGDSVFLANTVESVKAQPLAIQHVMVAPAEKIPVLQARFPHASVIADAGRAGGIYGALNVALAVADSWDWFTYINDDDTLLPDCGNILLKHLRATRREQVIYGDVELVDEKGCGLSRITVEKNPAWIPALLQGGISPLMQQGMWFQRQAIRRIGSFDQRYRLCADLDFWLRAYVAGVGFRYYPKRVARFRLRRGQLSGQTALTEHEQAEIVTRHLPRPVPPWEKRLARWQYRLSNLPRYLARVQKQGFRTSYQLLRKEGARS